MAKLNENQELRLNILRGTVNAIITSIDIIEMDPCLERQCALIDGIEEMIEDNIKTIRSIKDHQLNAMANPIFQNILNSIS